MRFRQLGRTGLRCSEVSLGTWAFASQVYGSVDDSSAREAVEAALDVGINFFDTAPLYGTSECDGLAETILSRALGSRRAEVLISTKFGRTSTDPSPNFQASSARASVESSLSRLQTDYIDVLFFHSPFNESEINDNVWGELEKLKCDGKIRFIGHSVSMFQDTKDMSLRWVKEGRIDVVQVVYSLFNRETASFIAEVGSHDVGVVARESLANGFLTGAFTKDSVFPANNLNSRYSREEIAERVEQADRLSFLVRRDVTSMAAAAMRWVLDNADTSTVLSGAKCAEEIRQCAAASDAGSFTSEEMAKADQLHQRDYSAA